MAAMVQVEVTETYKEWYLDLEKKEAAAVDRKVKMLQMLGVALPFRTRARSGARSTRSGSYG